MVASNGRGDYILWIVADLFFCWRVVVTTLTRIIGAVVLGFCLVGSASAAFTEPTTSDGYLGSMGDIETGAFGGLIGTHLLEDGSGSFVPNFNGYLTVHLPFGTRAVPHWYSFEVGSDLNISAFLELGGTDVQSMTISFFDSLDDTVNHTLELLAGYTGTQHDYPLIGEFEEGTWWMKIEGVSTGTENDSYTVKLESVPVPLPPAILLFVSALAGFGVMGRKKKQQLAS